MIRIPFNEVCQELTRILKSLEFDGSKAEKCAEIFTQNTCDGVASHGLNRFPRFVQSVKSGRVDINAEAERAGSMGALEQWNGHKGIGPLNAVKSMNRAIELSRKYGIGCVGLSNTNHWLRAGTYGLMAAKAGCIGICWTNTRALMPPWGSSEKKIGNNPMVMCVPQDRNPVLLDMAMSQFSNGKLEVLQRRGEQLPIAGGYDDAGELTTDPGAILKSRRALPIGYWKGSGLAILLDLTASLIANGQSTREVSRQDNDSGVSQIFIAIDVVSKMGAETVSNKVDAILHDLLYTLPLDPASKVRYPGQGLFSKRTENLKKGIPVDSTLWQAIQKL